MNKDLPKVIKDIFANPDPIIWKGIWLETLETLLKDIKLLKLWKDLLKIIENNHKQNTHINIEQYIKWELKAFVAQVVKLRQNNLDLNQFEYELKKYLLKKNLNLNEAFILEIYQSIYEN
tara:strand:- start:766 stop:1125 length:360 start_codon:yes stop_codon:yes gene_type:complete